MAYARAEDGTTEVAGKRHNEKILSYFRDAGHPEIIDDETAWCAAFANAMLERSGVGGTKMLTARSFLAWGVKLDKPRPGCIAVFERGNSTWEGHVGFYVGEDHSHVFVLGGNQWNPKTKRSEIVNVSRQPKSKLLGYRWPSTFSTSRTYRASALGLTSTSVGVIGEAGQKTVDALGSSIIPFGAELKVMASYLSFLGIVGSLITLLAFGIIIYARWDDARNHGG